MSIYSLPSLLDFVFSIFVTFAFLCQYVDNYEIFELILTLII